MGKGDEDMITSEELEARPWAGADRLRGSMDASRYKDYMLGLMFYKFLSEKTLEAFKLTEGTQAMGEELRQEYAAAYAEDGKLLTDDLMQTPGFYILPDDLYDKWLLDIDSGAFELQNVIDALDRFERMIAGAKNAGDFVGLFSTMDLTDTALGANLKVRSENIRELIKILDNGCNLNIPRYVENLDTEIPHDVDAHLLGGIPQRNLKAMEVLQTVVPDIMAHAFSELRPGYARMEGSMMGLRESILGDGRLAAEAGKLHGEVDAYIGKYWAEFKELGMGKSRNLVSLRAEMLQEVKDILSGHRFMDVYSGYQVIADLWAESLDHDLKLMMGEGFYEAARSVEPNLVTKGSGDKKREEQDGWKGRVIPNDIVAEILYADRLAEIRAQEEKLQELNGELSDWVEKAGSEDSAEGEVLGDTLKEDKSAFDSKALNAAWKEASGESERQMLKAVRDCLETIKKASKTVKEMELALKKDVEERYSRLTEEEIDRLLWRKWFANITEQIAGLVREPFERELDLLENILTRYGKTVDELDAEIAEQEREFEALASELVVTE